MAQAYKNTSYITNILIKDKEINTRTIITTE